MTVPELTVPEFSVGILRARIPIAGADPTTADHALHDPTKIDEEVYLLIPHSPLLFICTARGVIKRVICTPLSSFWSLQIESIRSANQLAMPGKTPVGFTTVKVESLGTLKGLVYENGVRQFCGIPYATLTKRWTRSTLATSWKNGVHDGTKLGFVDTNPICFSTK